MGVVDMEITCGNFKALRRVVALTGIPGEWTNGKMAIVNFVRPMAQF
jgi:hypothetical protein